MTALTTATKKAASAASAGPPWSAASSVRDLQGLNMMLFSFAGVGKTTLTTTALNSEKFGGPLLIVNFDEEVRSIADRDDIMVWPGEKQGGVIRSWDQAKAFLARLATQNHPFKTIGFDTVNSAYDKLALPWSEAKNPGAKDRRQVLGAANDEILRVIRDWCAISREKGTNVIFTCHAEEKQDGENGPIYIRPKITPGVVSGMYQSVSMIGYLEASRTNRPRRLILHPTVKVVAKIHQPMSGAKIPPEISNPDLGRIIDHFRHVRPYKNEEDDL